MTLTTKDNSVELEQLMHDRLGADWYEKLEPFLMSDEFNNIRTKLLNLSEETVIYPPAQVAYKAFKLCPYEATKVVILGQDPYHDGSADGLAFSTQNLKMPPSLKIILNKLMMELKMQFLRHTELSDLSGQGVLLLNTALSVVRKRPGSHLDLWRPFTQEVIKTLKQKEFLVWMLWGTSAAKVVGELPPKHKVIYTHHPAAEAYDNANVFEPQFLEVNKALEEHLLIPIDWYNYLDDLPF